MLNQKGLRLGIYIDHENVRLSGGSNVDYEVLLDYLSEGACLLRAVVYTVVDPDQSVELQERLHRYRDKLRYLGFKVLEKVRRVYINPDTGEKESKVNTDMELAIDVLREVENLDIVVIVSGDGGFVRLVEAVQSRGRRVRVVGFKNVSKDLRESADMYVRGTDIPNIFRVRPADQSDDSDYFRDDGRDW